MKNLDSDRINDLLGLGLLVIVWTIAIGLAFGLLVLMTGVIFS